MSGPSSGPSNTAATAREPLAIRLRAEAAEWGEGDDVVSALLLEAAEAIELLAARVGICVVMHGD